MLDLISFFQDSGFETVFCTAAAESEFAENLSSSGIETRGIQLNDSSFNEFITELKPDIVLFDRFMTEEQFGWRVDECVPSALKILDTEDLHFLREARKKAILNHELVEKADLYTDLAKREVASIYRSDLSLIISKAEMRVLTENFEVSPESLLYLPLKSKEMALDTLKSKPTFSERANFISIGNFLHEPNWDSVVHLKKLIWPKIREYLPKTNLLVYGAYPSQKVYELNNKEEGFLVKGRTRSVSEILEYGRVLLAPLRFGAGQKGKLLDAMEAGMPSVTTWIGAEGMVQEGQNWPGTVSETDADFIEAAIRLYTDEKSWFESQRNIPEVLNTSFADSLPWRDFATRIETLMKDLNQYRNKNFVGQMLRHHQHASTKYLSKWIEEKNKS